MRERNLYFRVRSKAVLGSEQAGVSHLAPSGATGFTVLELVVALAVIALLVAILLPALSGSRETSRRVQCAANLRQIGMALGAFEAQHQRFPSGLFHKYDLLPFLELQAVQDAVIKGAPTPTAAWAPVANVAFPVIICPSDGPEHVGGFSVTNYAGCFGSGELRDGKNGLFEVSIPVKGIRASEILDGLSNTAAVAETLHGDESWRRLRRIWETPVAFWEPGELDSFADYCDSIPPDPFAYGWLGSEHRGIPWYDCDRGIGLYNHVLTPNRPSCTNGTHVPTGIYTATSAHAGGVNVLFADGHVEFISESIDRRPWREFGARNNRLIGPTP